MLMAATPLRYSVPASDGCRPKGRELELREQKRRVKTPAFFAQRCLTAKGRQGSMSE